MILKKANFPKQEYNRDFKQITTNDSRFYEDGNKTYPSVTYVLSYYPKGKNFEDWLKKVGYASDFIAKKAADEGTIVHNLAESYLKGDKIDLMDMDQNPKYDLKVWKMFLRFVDFWETSKAELVETEVFLYSDNLNIAGTCDLVCKIDGKGWEVFESPRSMDENLKIFSHVRALFDLENPSLKPISEKWPTSVHKQ